MDEVEAFRPIKALIANLRLQLELHQCTLRGQNEKIERLQEIISSKDKIIKNRDNKIEGLQKLVKLKDHMIPAKDPRLLIPGNDDQKKKSSRFQQVEVVTLGFIDRQGCKQKFSQLGDWFGWYESEITLDKTTMRLDIESMTKFLNQQNRMLSLLHGVYKKFKKRAHRLQEESWRKQKLYEVGLYVRARKMELDLAFRNGSAPRANLIKSGNLAAHGPNAEADADMVADLKHILNAGGTIPDQKSRFIEQYKETYSVPHDVVLKLAKNKFSDFEYFMPLINFYEELKIWKSIVGGRYDMLRRRVKSLAEKVSAETSWDDMGEFDLHCWFENTGFGDLMGTRYDLEELYEERRVSLVPTRKGSKRA